MKRSLSSFVQRRFTLYFFKYLGGRLTLRYIYFLGMIYYMKNRDEKRKISKSVQAVFKGRREQWEIRAITRRVFQGILDHYYEKLYNAYEGNGRLSSFFNKSIRAEKLGALDKALTKGRGVLFVTGHYGGIEYIPIFLATRGYPISVVAKFSTAALKERLRLKTEHLGLEIIDAARKGGVLPHIMDALRRNRIVFFECDEIEAWKPCKKRRMTFLNQAIGVDRTLAVIQKRAGAVILFAVLHRMNLGHYDLIIRTYEEMKETVKNEANTTAGETVLRYFERYIYAHPEQWYQWKNYMSLGDAGGAVQPKWSLYKGTGKTHPSFAWWSRVQRA